MLQAERFRAAPSGHRSAGLGRACILALGMWLVPGIALGQRALAEQLIGTDTVTPIDMAIGRSIPMTTRGTIQRVSVANPGVADVVLISERELVLNAIASGVTDLIIWQTDGQKFHFRANVHSPTDRKQVILQVRIAEATRDLLREIGFSFLYRDQHARAGTGTFFNDAPIRGDSILIRAAGQFGTLLSIDAVENLTALLEVAEQTGRLRVLAEPNLIAANSEVADFLVGGELPIPVVQPSGVGGVQAVSIQFREFGIRLAFEPEILSEDLVKLKIEPEVSSLDFSNAITQSGFLIPAFRTRRTSTTVDLRRGQTLAIAGLLNSEEQKVITGIPFLKDLPLLGLLFSSQRFQRNETELIVLVTPQVLDPMSPSLPAPTPMGPGSGEGEGGPGQ